jgi:hypothetical protein
LKLNILIHLNDLFDFVHGLFFHSILFYLDLTISCSLISYYDRCIHRERKTSFISTSIISCMNSISNFICVKISMRYSLIAFSTHRHTKTMIEMSEKSNMFQTKSFRINFILKKFQKISIKIKWIMSIVNRFFEKNLFFCEIII